MGGAHTHCVDVSLSDFYTLCMSAILNKSSEIHRFKHSDVLEICDGIMFVFYSALSHVLHPRTSHAL